MQEASKGKDTTTGHWEISGLISPKAMPTYPHGFPPEIIREFEEKTGRHALCNRPYSGTKVILDYGREHERTGDLIVYTSADSVFQVAANEAVVPVEELYRCCQIARELLVGEHGVGRVIARPYVCLLYTSAMCPKRLDREIKFHSYISISYSRFNLSKSGITVRRTIPVTMPEAIPKRISQGI